MQNKDFTTIISTKEPATEVYKAILNPRAWWSTEIEGSTNRVGDIFDYHFEDIHRCKVEVSDLIPNRKAVWKILENDFNFTKDKTEWVNTTIVFEITQQDGITQLRFTHIGLVPSYECYDACQQGWTHYIQNSLKQFINTGEGEPNKTGSPKTETERKLKNKTIA